jgi:adenylate kinase family enzyme
MSDYDFRTLNDKEFEALCADLLSKKTNQRFERFSSGRDLGVDGRYFSPTGGEVILQCKHWAKTPVPQLIRSLTNIEKPKLDALRPERYILAVSNELTRVNKQQIFAALAPYIKSESDIYANSDLNTLLRDHPEIERQHYKLWMQSTAVIDNIFNRAIQGRSKDEMRDIQSRFVRYVLTENHSRAAAQLEGARVLIITGEPGVGKTTLADQLCYDFAAKGYDFIKLADDVAEAENVFDEDSKQLFYFDDFLGRNYLEALSGHEGSKIGNFIRRIALNKNKLFILTSRSTILNQGKILLDMFQHQNLARNEYEMKIASLSLMDRAKILYNHLWFSDLKPQYIEELYEGQRYLKIIKHKNFNPRLISYITDSTRLESTSAEAYWQYIESSLANPANVWENPFAVQQDDFTRSIVILTVLNGRNISEAELSEAYHNFIALPANQHLKGRQDFELNMRSLTGSLLNRNINKNGAANVDLFNPSIGDYVLARYVTNIAVLKSAFISLPTLDALRTLISLTKNGRISIRNAHDIVMAVLITAVANEFSDYLPDYLSRICIFAEEILKPSNQLAGLMDSVANKILSSADHKIDVRQIRAFHWSLDRGRITSEEALTYIAENIGNLDGGDDEISSCWALLQSITASPERAVVCNEFEDYIIDSVSGNLSEYVELAVAFSEAEYGDYESAREKIAQLVDEKFVEWGINSSRVDAIQIVSGYDVEYDMDKYHRNSYEGSYDGPSGSAPNQPSEDSAIIDLFDRG